MSDGFIGDERAQIPDLMDWVIGIRGFGRRGHHLMSPYQETVWERPELTGVCRPSKRTAKAPLLALGQKPTKATNAAAKIYARQQRLPPHDAPHLECHCGAYGYHGDDEHLEMWPIVGVVRARGRMIVHPRGFRAERVEVIALAFDPELGGDVEAQRLREVTRRACAWWRIPLLGRDQLLASLSEFGPPIPMALRPPHQSTEETKS